MKKEEKKGISAVIGTIILIAIVMAAGILVWVVINNTVRDKLEGVGSCTDVFDKVTLNTAYTCINTSSVYGTSDVIFSINRQDIEINKIVVSVSGGGSTKSFEISTEAETFTNLINYPYGSGLSVSLPGKNEGKTYIHNGTELSSVDEISIAPVVGDKQCDISDSVTDIGSCSIVLS